MARALLSGVGESWGASPPSDKTATTAITSPKRPSEGGFVGSVGFGVGEGDEAERAAIIEYDGGVPREWAEGLARLLSSPPPGVLPSRWLARINSAARFCDAWAGKASACGWTASELFGLHPAAQLNRFDGMGTAFLGSDGEVVDVTTEAVVIRLASGATQRVRRRPNPRPPAWETFE